MSFLGCYTFYFQRRSKFWCLPKSLMHYRDIQPILGGTPIKPVPVNPLIEVGLLREKFLKEHPYHDTVRMYG